MKLPGNLHLITDEIPAIVAVLLIDFAFLAAAFGFRDKFSFVEFYSLIVGLQALPVGVVWILFDRLSMKDRIRALERRIEILHSTHTGKGICGTDQKGQ